MPSAALYLGTDPSRTQDVNPVLRDRGIELIRCEPSKIKPIITLRRRIPQHSIYKDFFSLFAQKAFSAGGTFTSTSNDPFTGVVSPGLIPDLLKKFNVVFDFTHPINDSKMDQIRNAIPTVEQASPRGKPVFIIPDVTINHLVYVKAAQSLGCSTVTRAHAGTINLSALQTVMLLVRIANVFLRVNQYPIFGTDDDVDADMFSDFTRDSLLFDRGAEAVAYEEYDRGDGTEIPVLQMPVVDNQVIIHCNLPTRPNDFDYVIQNQDDLSGTLEGIVIPFVPELALPDAQTIPSVVRRYFMGFLSIDADSARRNFQKVLSDWGVLFNTPNGAILSHLFWSIDFCFQTQTTLRLIIQSAYCGTIIYGAGWTAQVGDREIEGNSPRNLKAAFGLVSPHTAALTDIFANMTFASDNDRNAGIAMCQSMQGLKAFLQTRQLSEDQREAILQKSKFLTYNTDTPPSLPNAFNIAAALRLINNTGAPIDDLHLPHSKLFETNRTTLIWCQFGFTAPSFKVPGGKTQDVSKKLRHRTRKNQNDSASPLETINTGRMGMIVIPLDRAIADLHEFLKTKTIHNPFASQIMARVSAKSMIKTIEGNSFNDVVSAMRVALEVMEPMDEGNGGPSRKRAHDEEDEDDDNERKRMRGFEF